MKLKLHRVISLLFVTTALVVFGKDGVHHINDIVKILFDGAESAKVRDLAAFVSQGMDMGSGLRSVNLADQGSSFWNTLRKEFGSLEGLGPDSHRKIGHWGMNGGIPEEFLDMLERHRPGCRPRVKELWKEFVATRREAVKQAFHLVNGPDADRVAQSLAAMMNDIHVIGDRTTKATSGLRRLKNIVNDYVKSLDQILGSNNTLSQRIKLEIQSLPSSLTSQQRAERILAILKRYSDETSRRITTVLRRLGYDGVVRPIDHGTLRTLTKLSGEIEELGAKRVASKAQYLRQRGHVQKLRVGGHEITKVDLPVVVDNHELYLRDQYLAKYPDKLKMSNATKGRTLPPKVYKGSKGVTSFIASPLGEGVTAGVLSFAISEGSTIIRYRQGELEDDKFRLETAFNSGKAVVEGSTICVLSSALAEAPFVVSFGTMIIGGIAIEKAGDVVWKAIEREVGDFPGVSEDELFFNVSDEVKRRRTVWDEGFINDVEQRTRKTDDPMKKGEEEEQWKKGNPFF